MKTSFKNLFKNKKTGTRSEEFEDENIINEKDKNEINNSNLPNTNKIQIISILKDKSFLEDGYSPRPRRTRPSKEVRFYIPFEYIEDWTLYYDEDDYRSIYMEKLQNSIQR